ncbi:MAG: histidine kinase, partial [Actinobacteria bacterium]|nr:histidine kinase [Actinomycetota bacterium]
TRDIHDGAQQKLVSVVLNLELARELTASDPEHAAELLETATRQARAAINELRELAAGIHPTLLTTRGLRAAVEALADDLPLPIHPLEAPEMRLPTVIEGSAYFVISEALTNVVKHAKAQAAGVRVAVTGTRLTVEVRDDGVGGAELQRARHGLAGLADRVGALGGTLQLESPKSSGTILRAEIPLPDAGDQAAR